MKQPFGGTILGNQGVLKLETSKNQDCHPQKNRHLLRMQTRMYIELKAGDVGG